LDNKNISFGYYRDYTQLSEKDRKALSDQLYKWGILGEEYTLDYGVYKFADIFKSRNNDWIIEISHNDLSSIKTFKMKRSRGIDIRMKIKNPHNGISAIIEIEVKNYTTKNKRDRKFFIDKGFSYSTDADLKILVIPYSCLQPSALEYFESMNIQIVNLINKKQDRRNFKHRYHNKVFLNSLKSTIYRLLHQKNIFRCVVLHPVYQYFNNQQPYSVDNAVSYSQFCVCEVIGNG
jgi:hypothetical protein